MATLCLIECSRHGLLESELLQLLADEDNLFPEEYAQRFKDDTIDDYVESAGKLMFSSKSFNEFLNYFYERAKLLLSLLSLLNELKEKNKSCLYRSQMKREGN